MHYKRLAAALFASVPLFAAAQSSNVQTYGVMDAAIASENNGVDGRHTVINSGNQSSSRIGFRGTEDLGGGLKAMFNIEAGVSIDTGNSDSALFGRRSVVGLEGDFGALTVGREYSPIASVAAASDVFGQGFYGSNLSAFGTNRLTRRLSNSVNYKSNSFSGFKVLAAYSAGEKTSGPSGDLKGVAAEYASGPLYVGAGYHTFTRVAGGDDKEYAVGAAYKIGDIDIKGNWMVADPEGTNNKFTQYNLGAAMGFGPGKVFVNLQQNKLETGAKGTAWAVAYSYALSKRTNLYTTYAKMDNNSLATFGLNSSSTSIAPPATKLGADPSVFNVGVRHSF
ncbi:porin [Massilia horti]|uniref:Porin n=1 Tax=Massilia horti TaxID=2562153 RepID=A0A4Y9TA20_9BURK|nr:porin [Massilia horti]TFW35012.1 porin [Massilia horti]